MPTMTEIRSRTATCSVRPAIRVPLDPDQDAGPLMEAIGDALEKDPRAIGAGGVGCDYDHAQLEATFQVALEPGPFLLERASQRALNIATDAIAAAGVDGHVTGVAVVEGDDPDLLP